MPELVIIWLIIVSRIIFAKKILYQHVIIFTGTNCIKKASSKSIKMFNEKQNKKTAIAARLLVGQDKKIDPERFFLLNKK